MAGGFRFPATSAARSSTSVALRSLRVPPDRSSSLSTVGAEGPVMCWVTTEPTTTATVRAAATAGAAKAGRRQNGRTTTGREVSALSVRFSISRINCSLRTL